MNDPVGPRQLDGSLHLKVVGQNRALYCPLYDSCLDLAANSDWKGWTCRGCAAFPAALLVGPVPIENVDVLSAMEALTEP